MNSITNNKEQSNSFQLSLSTNRKINSTLSKEEAAKLTRGWELTSVSWDKETLSNFVKNNSYVCSKLKDGYKVKDNVEEVYCIALDFDNTDKRGSLERISKKFKQFSKDDFINKAKNWEFSWFLHTTVTHQQTKLDDGTLRDKFRVIIPFSRPVNDSFIRNEIKSVWLKIFPNLDASCFQSERYYYLSPNAECELHSYFDDEENLVLFDVDSEELKSVKKDENKSPQKHGLNNKTFSLDQKVLLADKVTERNIYEIEVKTPIFCPYCVHDKAHRGNPESANAFVDKNSVGYYYIYCSSEDKTYWVNPKDKLLKNIKLFFNTSVGAPSQTEFIDPVSIELESDEINNPTKTMYVFKNDADFRNYCNNEDLPYSLKEYLVRASIIFNPKLPSGFHGDYYNLFQNSIYMNKTYREMERIKLDTVVDKLKQNTPTIFGILDNLFGDDTIIARFLNWNAYILQKRAKSSTAWLIQSREQEVGKDFMFNFILRPIYGERQSQLLNGSRIGKQFNSIDMHCFLRGYNEVFTNKDSQTNTYRKEWLKDRITGQNQDIEFKGVDTYLAKNFMNFILFSNNDYAIPIEQKDRRYNVVRNDKAMKVLDLPFYKGRERLAADVSNELESFADIIFTLEYDTELANTAIETSAKNDLKNLSADEYDKFVDALRNGDSDYFLLDEIFKPDKSDELFSLSSDGVVWSARALEAKRIINEHRVILAADMNAIIKFFFPKSMYRDVRDKFKQRKLISKQKRLAELGNPKVYMIDETEV